MAALDPVIDTTPAPSPETSRQHSTLGAVVWELFRHPQTAVGTLIVLFFLLIAIFGPTIAPYTENDQHHPIAQAPSIQYPLGTDFLGRDVYSRVILGARSILFTAAAGTLIAVLLGTFIGLAVGYQGGLLDEVVGRFVDSLLSLPALLLALVILGVLRNVPLTPGTWQSGLANNSALLVIGLVYTPLVTRVVRSSTLDVKTREFIWAAQIRGESWWYILFREILPSVTPALVVEASLRFSYAIFLVASLGFLGVGARPPSPNWGLMVNESRGGKYLLTPWALNYPALAIAILVVGVNLMSDGIRRIVQRSR